MDVRGECLYECLTILEHRDEDGRRRLAPLNPAFEQKLILLDKCFDTRSLI
jgi:hypothetical protein